MKKALQRHGWRNYSIFMKDDGLLFGYFETSGTFEEALCGMEGEPINSTWQELMSPYFEIPTGSTPDKMMIELEEVFHLEKLKIVLLKLILVVSMILRLLKNQLD